MQHSDNPPNRKSQGPIYLEDGRLALEESFNDFLPKEDARKLLGEELVTLESDWLVEIWRIWDCYEEDWADFDLTLYRYESADLIVRNSVDGKACYWIGAIDQRKRLIRSMFLDNDLQPCWQWLRDKNTPTIASLI